MKHLSRIPKTARRAAAVIAAACAMRGFPGYPPSTVTATSSAARRDGIT